MIRGHFHHTQKSHHIDGRNPSGLQALAPAGAKQPRK